MKRFLLKSFSKGTNCIKGFLIKEFHLKCFIKGLLRYNFINELF